MVCQKSYTIENYQSGYIGCPSKTLVIFRLLLALHPNETKFLVSFERKSNAFCENFKLFKQFRLPKSMVQKRSPSGVDNHPF